MKLFNKGGGDEPQRGSPVEQIIAFRQQGLSNNQIVESLQRSGYTTDKIFAAMNQADLQNAGPVEQQIPPEQAEQFPGQTGQFPGQPSQFPEQPDQFSSSAEDPLGQPPSYAEEEYAEDPASQGQDGAYEDVEEVDTAQFEEIAEQIVEEKWQRMEQDREKLAEWKQHVDTRLERIEQRFADVRMELQSLHKALFERMDGYDKNVSKIGVNLRAMDEVFRKTLPKLTENINDLSSLTDSLKKPSRKK